MELTMLPWHLLSIATVGLSDLFFGCAYRTAVRAEFFAHVRAQVKAEGDAQALRDTYLYERASEKALRNAYNDLKKTAEAAGARLWKQGFPLLRRVSRRDAVRQQAGYRAGKDTGSGIPSALYAPL